METVKTARCVIRPHDLDVFEDLQIRNLVRNGTLAKSISDAVWGEFRSWLECFGLVYGKAIVAAPLQYTSQQCSQCGTVLDLGHNAAINLFCDWDWIT